MKIADTYSHLNGVEYLLVHQPGLYKEIQEIVESIDADSCRTKISQEKTMRGKSLYSPKDVNHEFKRYFAEKGWESETYQYYITTDRNLLEKTLNLPIDQQKEILQKHGISSPILS